MVFSQATDTVALARSLAYASDLDSADLLLSSFNANHTDLGGLWLHAQVLYWRKEFKRSDKVFERSITAFPESHYLHLEYGRTLWERGKLFRAQARLRPFLEYNSLHQEANLMQAKIDYWNGKLRRARARAEQLLDSDPEFFPAKELLAEMKSVSSPWWSLQTGYFSDDQPLQAIRTDFKTGRYLSWWLAPALQVRHSHFLLEETYYPFLTGLVQDQIFIGRTKTYLTLSAGVLAPLVVNSPVHALGGVLLSQRLPAHFVFDIGVEKRPYLYTVHSIKSPFTENFLQIALRFDHSGKWLGKAALEWQAFPDDNIVQTAYAWFLAPLVDRKWLRIQAGYAYSFADADRSRFLPLKPYNPGLPPENPVAGTYDPYFTPANQQIHSVLASIRLSPARKLQFSASASAGVSANADIPYFYPNSNSQGNWAYVRDHARYDFSPLEINGEIRLGLGRRGSLSAKYTFQRLLFYVNQYGGLQFQYQFLP